MNKINYGKKITFNANFKSFYAKKAGENGALYDSINLLIDENYSVALTKSWIKKTEDESTYTFTLTELKKDGTPKTYMLYNRETKETAVYNFEDLKAVLISKGFKEVEANYTTNSVLNEILG